jgi:hypothetical protein
VGPGFSRTWDRWRWQRHARVTTTATGTVVCPQFFLQVREEGGSDTAEETNKAVPEEQELAHRQGNFMRRGST